MARQKVPEYDKPSPIFDNKPKLVRPKEKRYSPKTFLSRKAIKELLGDKNFVRMLNAYVFLDDRQIGSRKEENRKRPYYADLEAILARMNIGINTLYPPKTPDLMRRSRNWRSGFQAKLDERYK